MKLEIDAPARGREGAVYGVTLAAGATIRWLGGIAAAILALHLTVQVVHHYVRPLHWLLWEPLHVDIEASFATWYSCFLLLVTTFFLHAASRLERSAGGRWTRHWNVLALGFLLLSLDELVGFHESLNTVTTRSWVGPGAAVAALVGLAYLPFLRGLPRVTAARFLVAGALYLGGALGVELASTRWLEAGHPRESMGYALWTAWEEGLEMLGVLVFLHALLRHLEARVPTRSGRRGKHAAS